MRSTFIAVFLILQLGIPLSYYWGDAPLDERFAWRMFSPIRMRPCQVAVFDGDSKRPVPIEREYHVVWRNLLRRARPSVIRSIAEDRCQKLARSGQTPKVRMLFRCDLPSDPDWRPVEPDQNLCEVGL